VARRPRRAPGAARPAAGLARLALGAVVVAVPLVLVAADIHLLASEAFLRLEYGRPGFPPAPGFTAEERLAAAVPSTLFLVRGDGDRAALEALADPATGAPLYEPDEVRHVVDARILVRRITDAAALGGLVVLVAALLWLGGRLPGFPRALATGGWITVSAVVLLGAGILLAWPLFFTTFHELLFPPGTWQFPAESGLIRLFPGQFWYDTAVVLAGLLAIEGLAVALAARWVG
jgi:hypothetical protein